MSGHRIRRYRRHVQRLTRNILRAVRCRAGCDAQPLVYGFPYMKCCRCGTVFAWPT